MTKDATTNRLLEVVQVRIDQDPFEADGYIWASASQKWWCDQVEVSAATLRRLISCPPFVRKRTHVNGRPVTLLRMGTPGPRTPRDYANILSAIWRKRLARSVTRREFGCCCGLVEVWPEGKAPELLNLVLDNWEMFMAGVKIEMDEIRYYRYPSLSVIRRFSHVACEMLMMEKQQSLKGSGASPGELNATLSLLAK